MAEKSTKKSGVLQSIYDRLEKVLSSVAPDSYARDAIARLKNEHSYHPDYKLGLNGLGYPMEVAGLNLTSQPGNYLPSTVKKEYVKLNRDLPYDTGGQTNVYGIQLNPNSMFDKAGVLVHEASHNRDYGPSGVRVNLPAGLFEAIRDKMIDHKNSRDDYRTLRILSGQREPEEVRAQMRAYEALLPAGMSMFQSPMGKDVFTSPEEKLWYINQTQPSMSDQSYLDELSERQKKQKYAKGGLIQVKEKSCR
jgi:hypothetical protein